MWSLSAESRYAVRPFAIPPLHRANTPLGIFTAEQRPPLSRPLRIEHRGGHGELYILILVLSSDGYALRIAP